MSERPCSPPDLQETPPRLCRRQEAPAVLRSAVASLQSSRRVPRVRLHILSPLHASLGPNLPTYKRTQSSGPQPVPVASPTPLLPQRAHLRVRPHPQGQGSGPPRTSLGTKGSPSPGLGEISPRPKGTQRSVWELGLQRQAHLLHCSGGFPGRTCRGFCPCLGPAGVVPASQAQSESAERLSRSWRLPASMSWLFCGSLHSRRTFSAPPPPPSCSGWSSGYQPERGGWGGAREGRSLRARHPPM